MYLNVNNPANYQLQSFGQDGMRTISTTQAYVEGEYYRVLVATEDSTLSATSMVGDDLASIDVYAGTTIYGLFTAVTVTAGEVTAYLAGRTDIDDVWAYIRAYGEANGATIEGEDCAKAAISPLLDKYYAQASLVMVPSLYKTSIVYSERPLSTDGELTFTRASSATRVAANGYIEKERTNVATYSQDFTNWSLGAVSVTTSATANPLDGSLDSQDITPTATLGVHRVLKINSGGLNSINTWSVYAKANGYDFITIVENGNTGARVAFNLSTGAVGSASLATGQIESLGGGWYRCSMIHTTSTTPRFDIYVSPTDSLSAYTADGTSGVTLFGAQAEVSDFGPTPYIATTAAAVSVGPVANLPRLNYPINSDDSVGCPSLLLEPQRTNLATYSESFDNAAWTKSGATVTANATTSPDGYTNADKLVEDTSTALHEIWVNIGGAVSGADFAYSVFAKKGERDKFYVGDGSGGSSESYFDLTNGTLLYAGPNTNGSSIEDYGNGWYKCTCIFDRLNTTRPYTVGVLEDSYTTGNRTAYTGDGTSGIYIWGAQLEAGAYATSYIPTLGSASTRGADACSKTGISSLIGQTEGTIFAEVNVSQLQGAVGRTFIDIGSAGNRVFVGFTSLASNTIRLQIDAGGVAAAVDFRAVVSSTGTIKVAAAYKTGDCALYVNGVAGTLLANGAISFTTISDLFLGQTVSGTAILGDGITQALVFKTRLSNSSLAELTTL